MRIPTSIDVRVPDTADGWELYVGHPGAEDAAREIHDAVVALIGRVPIGAPPSEVVSAYVALDPLLSKWADVGAADSEPSYHIRRVLRKVYGEEVL